MSQRSKLHQIWDIGSLLALVTTVTAIIWQHGHDSAWKENFSQQTSMRFNFIEQQIGDIKDSQNKMLEILVEKNNNGH